MTDPALVVWVVKTIKLVLKLSVGVGVSVGGKGVITVKADWVKDISDDPLVITVGNTESKLVVGV